MNGRLRKKTSPFSHLVDQRQNPVAHQHISLPISSFFRSAEFVFYKLLGSSGPKYGRSHLYHCILICIEGPPYAKPCQSQAWHTILLKTVLEGKYQWKTTRRRNEHCWKVRLPQETSFRLVRNSHETCFSKRIIFYNFLDKSVWTKVWWTLKCYWYE